MKKKIMKIGLVAALFVAATEISTAQTNALHVNSQGNVGINTTTPSGKLHVESSNYFRTLFLRNNNTLTSSKYGIYNYVRGDNYVNATYNYAYQNPGATSSVYGVRTNTYARGGAAYGQYNYLYRYEGTGVSYGLYSYVAKSSTVNSTEYGIYSRINGTGTGAKYGVYSTVPTTAANWYAGYFDGNVQITGSLTVASDASKKKNIKSIDNAVALVQQLDGKSYEYIDDGKNNFSQGTQYGFLAQELQKVIPELVADIEAPGVQQLMKEGDNADEPKEGEVPMDDFKEGEADNYKSVNYIGLIPILVEAIKEQQSQLEQQQILIDELRSKLK